MGNYKKLEIELDILLQNHADRRTMECAAYKFLMIHGHGFVDIAHVEDTAVDIVKDYIQRHKWKYFLNWLSLKLINA
jgi:hypothetical protein